ncbi:AAA family ATPase [Massilia sp. METH4]|uniref:AAA family ATPase n=1 Tax=Massilia sp. METH4 TaxID=3123041 RepID=UPI0030CF32F8
MRSVLERRLALFVDRDSEMQRFRDLLKPNGKPIMIVSGDSGLGKSSLLARMVHECASSKIYKAEVLWTDTRNHDYLALMRKVRDDLGVEHFHKFTDLVNFFTVPHYHLTVDSSIRVGDSLVNRGHIGEVAGILIKDCMLNIPRDDMAVPENERMIRLTDRFFDELEALSRNNQVVVFLDAVEKMTADTERWICDEFVRRIHEGELNNVKLLAFGQRKPKLPSSRQFIEEAQLQPISEQHIVEYMAKRGVPEEVRGVAAGIILVASHGNPCEMANLVEAVMARLGSLMPPNE